MNANVRGRARPSTQSRGRLARLDGGRDARSDGLVDGKGRSTGPRAALMTVLAADERHARALVQRRAEPTTSRWSRGWRGYDLRRRRRRHCHGDGVEHRAQTEIHQTEDRRADHDARVDPRPSASGRAFVKCSSRLLTPPVRRAVARSPSCASRARSRAPSDRRTCSAARPSAERTTAGNTARSSRCLCGVS